jgi:hypothetical protein
MIIIKFSSIRIYLRANLTVQKPAAKLARVRSTKQQNTNKIQTNSVYVIIIIIIIIIFSFNSLTTQRPMLI